MRRVGLCLLVGLLLAGCANAVPGTPTAGQVLGAAQTVDGMSVTLTTFLDPAPVFPSSPAPPAGTTPVAARFTVENHTTADYLVDAVRDAAFVVRGHAFPASAAVVTTDPLLDRIPVAPGDKASGWVTADVPAGDIVDQVRYGQVHWLVGAGTHGTPPDQPMPGEVPQGFSLGEQVTLGGLTVSAVRVTDPADRVQPGIEVPDGLRDVQVDFTVDPGAGDQGNPAARTMVLYNAADEPVRANDTSMAASVRKPLTPGRQVTWPVQFLVPEGFTPQRVTFTAGIGATSTKAWWWRR